jgi:hypothetical protein
VGRWGKTISGLIALSAIGAWLILRPPQPLVDALLPPEPETLLLCEHATKEALRSPATYQRVKSIVGQVQANRVTVFINFDAANAYGTLIRGLVQCELGVWEHTQSASLLSVQIDGEDVDALAVTLANANWITERSNRPPRTLLELFR